MNKKVLGLLSVVTVSAAIFFTTNVSNNPKDTDLTQMIGLNTANAECKTSSISNGKCLQLSQICVGDPGNNECDF